ncbi:discoidin domain-containing protein [Paenibacillus sp. N1-5-1-14]|uniref:discoidin domain-containing protein n=1 Tax=Paenibacillus radicibacter TaxID=2972488 RepID=UPI0021592975|nr:discoidin domain-containing protein [Paenibacillus radicibacter]MCR8641140.1 discoidin domain-containing protein [Paenibacillus radicibacter]
MTGNWWKPVAGTPIPDTQAPTVPSNVTATAVSSSQINLTWSASTDNVGVTGYNVFRNGTQLQNTTGTSFTDTGLTPSTTYSYTVKAFDAAGNVSANSSSASATTLTGTPTTGNLALGKPAVASSVEAAGFEAAKAFDGNATTRWASVEGSDPQWIYVDLGSIQTINNVKLIWEAAYGKKYKIQVSTDSSAPTNWVDVFSTTVGDGGTDTISFADKPARYVRMYGTGRGTAYGYSLFTFEVSASTAKSLNQLEIINDINEVVDAENIQIEIVPEPVSELPQNES